MAIECAKYCMCDDLERLGLLLGNSCVEESDWSEECLFVKISERHWSVMSDESDWPRGEEK